MLLQGERVKYYVVFSFKLKRLLGGVINFGTGYFKCVSGLNNKVACGFFANKNARNTVNNGVNYAGIFSDISVLLGGTKDSNITLSP